LASCSSAPPPADPPLIADPPRTAGGGGADDGALETEIEQGLAYVKAAHFDEAKVHFQRAVALRATPRALTYLGIADEKTGDREGAVAAYKRALAVDGGFVEAAQNLAALYLDDPARPDDAIAVLRPALAKSPDPRLFQNLGYALSLKGDVDGASHAYESAVSKGEDAQVRFAWGSLLLDAKQPDKAAEQLKRALAAAPDDAAFLASLGRLLGSAHAFGECVKALDRAIRLKSTDPEWYVRRGTCKHQVSDDAGAHADYDAAIKVDPSFAAGHYYLGLAFKTEHNRLKAGVELETAVKLAGDGPLGKAAAQQLKELRRR